MLPPFRFNPSAKRRFIAAAGLASIVSGVLAFYAVYGSYGAGVLRYRGGSIWTPVGNDDQRLTPSMRLALSTPQAVAVPGPFAWTGVAPGFETAELPVLVSGAETDRILLARIDPAKFKFEVFSDPAGKLLGDWMQTRAPALIINGSYFAKDGTPDTPLISNGRQLGPKHYDARHGAFVAVAGQASVRDLAAQSWQDVLSGASNGFVSYPMLIGADGKSRTAGDQGWLANRSFVAEDRSGNIILGTTKDAFFTLPALAAFLQAAPLDLRLALNLDGGPVACQGIDFNGFKRAQCGAMELARTNGRQELLQPVFKDGQWAMTIVLAVTPKS